MEKDSKLIVLYLIISLFGVGCAHGNYIMPTKQTMVVDIYNYFQKEHVDSSLGIVSFENQDTCLQLTQGISGDYYCDFLKDRIVMYYPDDYNIVFMLCDPPTASNNLYVYIDSTRYLVRPQKSFAIYGHDEFFSKFLYLLLQRGDSLLTNERAITLSEEHMFEILDVDGEFLKVREVEYDETHIPRIKSRPSNQTFLYRWRDGYNLYTKQFVIDE